MNDVVKVARCHKPEAEGVGTAEMDRPKYFHVNDTQCPYCEIDSLRQQLTELQKKVGKLKSLILLTDYSVSDVEMNDTARIQWQSFICDFPGEQTSAQDAR